MDAVEKTCVLLAALSVFSVMLVCTSEFIPEDCGDVQYDVENGMIRLPDFSGESIRNLNCSWTYTAPVGRKLLVKVDSVHLPPLELRTSQFQLYIDDTLYDIPRNCVKCLREMVGGKVLNVIFTSYVSPSSEYHLANASESGLDGIGSFQIRYKAFDPHRCGKPEQIENGFVISKSKRVGQSIFYHCNPPYDLIGDSELRCIVSPDSPVPEWSSKPPKCAIQDCTGEPIIKKGSSGAIASPGYPTYVHQFSFPCVWEVIAQPNQQIKISITYLNFPKNVENSFTENVSRLSLIDGDYSSYIVNMTESLSNGPLNFTTLTNKLIVEFTVPENPKNREEAGVFVNYSFVSSSCPTPQTPKNGDIISYNTDLASTVTYRCHQGFVLVGELHAECLFNGQWSHPPPSCEPISILAPFLSATNDSDTVTAKLAEIPVNRDIPKYPKNGRKKASEALNTKDASEIPPTKQVLSEPFSKGTLGTISSQNITDANTFFVPKEERVEMPTVMPEKTKVNGKSPKQSEKESGNGPKSEPHLLQVIPPKENVKKSTNDNSASSNPSTVTKHLNASEPQEQLPPQGTGFVHEFNITGLKLSFTMLYIILGVGIPLIVIIILVIVVIIYRRKYPVRMRFGRKFSTFENPMYVSKDAQHPRELKRLTK